MKTDPLTAAVRQALKRSPCSVRALAREAGVPDSTLSRISTGKLTASPAVAEALVGAFHRWGEECRKLSAAIAAKKGGSD